MRSLKNLVQSVHDFIPAGHVAAWETVSRRIQMSMIIQRMALSIVLSVALKEPSRSVFGLADKDLILTCPSSESTGMQVGHSICNVVPRLPAFPGGVAVQIFRDKLAKDFCADITSLSKHSARLKVHASCGPVSDLAARSPESKPYWAKLEASPRRCLMTSCVLPE